MGFACTKGLTITRILRRAASSRRPGRSSESAGQPIPLRGAPSFFALPAALIALAALLALTSCGAGNGRFRIEGRFRNLNRGEFYVYSPDGGTTGRGGRRFRFLRRSARRRFGRGIDRVISGGGGSSFFKKDFTNDTQLYII